VMIQVPFSLIWYKAILKDKFKALLSVFPIRSKKNGRQNVFEPYLLKGISYIDDSDVIFFNLVKSKAQW